MKFRINKLKNKIILGIILGVVVLASVLILIPYKHNLLPYWCYDAEDFVFSVEISYDGSHYLAGTDSSLLLFDNSGSMPTINFTEIDHAWPITISADGKYIATIDRDELHVFSKVNASSYIQSLNISSESWWDVEFSLNGEYFVATRGSRLILYSTSDFKPIWSFTNNTTLFDAEISVDGSSIVVKDNRFLYFFSILSNKTLWNCSIYSGLTSPIALSTNGEYLVYGGRDSRLILFHKSNPLPIWVKTLSDGINSVDISYDGSYIAAACRDGAIYVFNHLSPEPMWTYSAPWPVDSISLSSDGMCFAAISTISTGGIPEANFPPPEGILYVFNTYFPFPLMNYDFNEYVYMCDISSDGKEVLVGVSDGRICLFKI